MKTASLILAAVLISSPLYAGNPTPVRIPNFDCSDTTLSGFRFRYDQEPHFEQAYVENHKWVRPAVLGGRKCIAINAPAAVLGGQTAKIETAFVPIEPGATYRYEVDYYLDGTGIKMFSEAFGVDPRPDAVREAEEAKGKRLTISRFKPANGLPAILMLHRGAAPDLSRAPLKTWATAVKEFTLPMESPVNFTFTAQGDGVRTSFPVEHQYDKESTFQVVEVRLLNPGQTLPVRMNLGQDYTLSGNLVNFAQPLPAGSSATILVRWKIKPRFLTIKCLAVGGPDGSTLAFTNFRLTKIKEPGEASASNYSEVVK